MPEKGPIKAKIFFTKEAFLESQFKDFVEAQTQINRLADINEQVHKQKFLDDSLREFLMRSIIEKLEEWVEKRKEALDAIKANL